MHVRIMMMNCHGLLYIAALINPIASMQAFYRLTSQENGIKVEDGVPFLTQSFFTCGSNQDCTEVAKKKKGKGEFKEVIGQETNGEDFVSYKKVKDLIGHVWRFESFNFPGYYMRLQDSLVLIAIFQNTDQYNLDSSWRVVKGLCGFGISFQSKNNPNYFIRINSYQARIEEYDNTALFRMEASFILHKGLANNEKYSFESANFRGYFLRHSSFYLRIDRFDKTDLFKKDATFYPKFLGY